MNINALRGVLVFACAALSASCAAAATTTANLSVTATVADSCTVTAPTGLTFATVNSATTTNETTPGGISVLCTANQTGLTVTLGSGNNENAGQRRMIDVSSNYLPYNLFSDSGHGTSVAVGGTLYSGNATALTPLALPVYGQIPSGSYAAGVYADTVVVTLTYN